MVAAGSGEEAAELLDGEHAQLAVLDIGLPGMDGFAVAEQLAPDVPVIIVTGDPVGAYARMQGRVEHFQVLPEAHRCRAARARGRRRRLVRRARPALRHSRQPARARGGAGGGRRARRRQLAARRRLRDPEPVAARDARAARGAAERDVDSRERRALGPRAARHPGDEGGVRAARARRHPRRRDRPSLPSARTGRARRCPLRARLAALGRRELRAAAPAATTSGCSRECAAARWSSGTATCSSAGRGRTTPTS